MAKYYVSDIAQNNGDHEVHNEACDWLPLAQFRTELGDFSTCREAMREAKKYHEKVNGCFYCAKPCNEEREKSILEGMRVSLN